MRFFPLPLSPFPSAVHDKTDISRGALIIGCDASANASLLAASVYGSQADYAPDFDDGLWDMMADQRASIGGIVVYDNWYLGPETLALYQLSKNIPEAEHPKETHHLSQVHIYPGTSSAGFIFPGHPDFKISSAGVAHTRALTFLKKYLGGPYFDLEKIWEEHTFFEFGDRSVERTMATMVQEPYVNHVPTVSSLSLSLSLCLSSGLRFFQFISLSSSISWIWLLIIIFIAFLLISPFTLLLLHIPSSLSFGLRSTPWHTSY